MPAPRVQLTGKQAVETVEEGWWDAWGSDGPSFRCSRGIAALGLAPGARAGDLYLTGNLAISTGTGDSGGSTDPFFHNTGSDSGLRRRPTAAPWASVSS